MSHRQTERKRERICDVKSLICNGCVTQMLGVICQPGLSHRAQAALGGKELDTVLSLFTPTHNGGTCKYQPPPLTLALLVASYGVLPRIWTQARPYGGGRGRGGGLVGPIWVGGRGWHRSHHVLLLLCIRIGNDGLLSEGPPGFPWV